MQTPYRNIARVVKPQGRNGEVVVAALRGLPFCLRAGMDVALTPPALDRDRFVRVLSVSEPQGGSARVRLSCSSSLSEAEPLAGLTVLARREDLDLPEDALAYDELIGRVVEDVERGELGLIEEVMETPAHDVWVIRGDRFGEVLLPVVDEVVEHLGEDGAILVRALPGLLGEGAA